MLGACIQTDSDREEQHAVFANFALKRAVSVLRRPKERFGVSIHYPWTLISFAVGDCGARSASDTPSIVPWGSRHKAKVIAG